MKTQIDSSTASLQQEAKRLMKNLELADDEDYIRSIKHPGLLFELNRLMYESMLSEFDSTRRSLEAVIYTPIPQGQQDYNILMNEWIKIKESFEHQDPMVCLSKLEPAPYDLNPDHLFIAAKRLEMRLGKSLKSALNKLKEAEAKLQQQGNSALEERKHKHVQTDDFEGQIRQQNTFLHAKINELEKRRDCLQLEVDEMAQQAAKDSEKMKQQSTAINELTDDISALKKELDDAKVLVTWKTKTFEGKLTHYVNNINNTRRKLNTDILDAPRMVAAYMTNVV